MPSDALQTLVPEWLSLEEAAAALGVDTRRVRRLLQERHLVAVRQPAPSSGGGSGATRLMLPALLILDGAPLPDLAGTVTLLADAGYTDEEALTWLFTPDETLPGTPVEALRSGHKKTEVRRRAQAMAF